MIASEEFKSVAEGFLAVVGHIYDDGVFVLESLYHLAHDGVVVECGIIIVGKQHSASLAHLGPFLLIVGFLEMFALRWETVVIVGVLPFEMQYGESGGVGMLLAILHHNLVVVSQHSSIVFIQLGITHVKLGFAQNGIVEEETTAEVIYSLLGLGQKLIGDE